MVEDQLFLYFTIRDTGLTIFIASENLNRPAV